MTRARRQQTQMQGEMSNPGKDKRVVIVGAGPVGMVCALALNRSGCGANA